MNRNKLTEQQKNIRTNIRNFLLTADLKQLNAELEVAESNEDSFRVAVIQELIEEFLADR